MEICGPKAAITIGVEALMKKAIIFAGLMAVFVAGCSSGSEDTSSATTGTTGTAAPTTTGSTATTAPAGGGYTAVQAVFTAKCAGCHGDTNPKAGISLTSYDKVMAGGKEGPVITAGDPDASLLVKAIKGAPGAKKMPPGPPLAADQIKTIEDWVKAGAKNG